MSDAEQFLSHLPESQITADRSDPSSDSMPQPTIEPDTTTHLPMNGFRDDGGGDRRLHIIARYQAEEMALNDAAPDILRPPSLPFPWLMADQDVTDHLGQSDQGDGSSG